MAMYCKCCFISRLGSFAFAESEKPFLGHIQGQISSMYYLL